MQTFQCYICSKTMPITIRNVHHKVPKAAGGPDTKDNLVDLCTGCHDQMHALATMLKNPAKAGQVNDHLQMLWPNDLQAHRRCMELAFLVYKSFMDKKEGENEDVLDNQENIVFTLPNEFKLALKMLASETKQNGRKMGMGRYVERLVLQHLAQKYPVLRQKIAEYISNN